MDANEIYATSLGALFAFFIGWRIAVETAAWRLYLQAMLRKYAGQMLLMTRANSSDDVTIGSSAAVASILAANVTAISYRAANQDQLLDRLGKVALINLVPLFLTGRTNTIANACLLLPQHYRSLLHHWLGRICAVELVTHAIIRMYIANWKFKILDIVLLATASILVLTSMLFVRRAVFELFLKLHSALALTLVAVLWFQVDIGLNISTITLAVACTGWVLHACVWTGRFVYRNIGGKGAQVATVLLPPNHEGPIDVMLLEYVFITIPSLPLSVFGRFQSHPYIVAWTDENERSQLCDTITLLVETRRGFSNHLRLCRDGARVLVDGPYGQAVSLNEYDTVLYVATGVGIAAHLLSIRRLLQAHRDRTARVRRVSLWWFIDTPDQEAWARPFLETLMDTDEQERRIFTIVISRPHSREVTASNHVVLAQDSSRSRWTRASGMLSLSEYLNSEWDAEAGNMVVCLCGEPLFERKLRNVIRQSQHDISLVLSPFRMDAVQSGRPVAREEEVKRTKHAVF